MKASGPLVVASKFAVLSSWLTHTVNCRLLQTASKVLLSPRDASPSSLSALKSGYKTVPIDLHKAACLSCSCMEL
jgi:hypothetical protein